MSSVQAETYGAGNNGTGKEEDRMKKCKSMLCCLFAGVLLASLLSACGKKPPTETTTDEPTGAATEDYLDDLENYNFGGAEFNVLSVTSQPGTYTQFDSDGLGGTVLDDAVYRRNREIEARFNIVFYDEYDIYQKCYTRFNTQFFANDNGPDSFDLIMLINRDAYSAVLQNSVLPVREIPHIDQTKDYYMHDINEAMTLNGQQFLCYSDESLYTFQRTTCLVYNQAIAKANGMPDFYQLVRDGEWTMEEMFRYMKQVTTVDETDGSISLYGLYGHGDYMFSTFYAAAGENYVTKTDTSLKFTALSNERMDRITNLVLEQMGQGCMGYSYDYVNPDDCYQVFIGGKSLFTGTVIGKLLLIKDVTGWDYGVLPYPMYEAGQNRYYSRVVDAWLHVAPRYVKNLERTGVILEALASGSSRHVFPAFYENQISARSIRDPESKEMLELIRSVRVMDWGGTVFASTIRSEVEKSVFVEKTDSLGTLCRGLVPVVNALIKEANDAAEALARQTAGDK